jgi:hypothetical protein
MNELVVLGIELWASHFAFGAMPPAVFSLVISQISS